jgi:hypothetical protein
MRWLVLTVLLLPAAARAEEPLRLQVTIRDHRFQPAELHVPTNAPFIIDVQNDDPTAEEFESAELGVEKVIAGGRHLPVRIRAMPPGRYSFMGEYHSDTAQGVVIVDPAK